MEYTTQTIIHNGVAVNIHRPILSENERAKQEKRVVETLNIIQITKEGGRKNETDPS